MLHRRQASKWRCARAQIYGRPCDTEKFKLFGDSRESGNLFICTNVGRRAPRPLHDYYDGVGPAVGTVCGTRLESFSASGAPPHAVRLSGIALSPLPALHRFNRDQKRYRGKDCDCDCNVHGRHSEHGAIRLEESYRGRLPMFLRYWQGKLQSSAPV